MKPRLTSPVSAFLTVCAVVGEYECRVGHGTAHLGLAGAGARGNIETNDGRHWHGHHGQAAASWPHKYRNVGGQWAVT